MATLREGVLRSSVLAAQIAWVTGPFLAAGDIAWRAGWLYYGVLIPGLLGHLIYVRARNPGLRRARGRIGANTPSWDLAWNAIFWWLMAGGPILAGVQHRARGGLLSGWTVLLGAALVMGGLAISALAMAHNPFFEGTVRLQTDRDQRVVDTGPYARIRHPGYLGLCLWAAGTPLLLRSMWSLPIGVATVVWVGIRTGLEDQLLCRGLQGYEAYARRVRWRLLPRVW